MAARRFIKDTLSVPRNATEVILHTRFATQGSETNNDNNHPIRVGPVVGVHNGVISNDWQLFNRMGIKDKRQAEVDTEAIFAAIYYGPQFEEGKNWRHLSGCTGPADALSEVRGSAAVAWLDERDDSGILHLARTQQSPLAWVQTMAGSLVFASSMEAILESLEIFQMVPKEDGYMKEGQYCIIQHGAALDVQEFKPAAYFGGRTFGGAGYSSAWDWDNYDDYTPTRCNSDLPITIITPVQDSELVESLNPDVEVARTDGPVKREEAIDEWMKGLIADDQAALCLAMELKAFTRIGDWASTEVIGEDCYAQVVELPEAFPGGWYVLRTMVPGPDKVNYEAVLVRRRSFEFELVSRTETADALGLLSKVGVDSDPLAIARKTLEAQGLMSDDEYDAIKDSTTGGKVFVATGVREFEVVNAACLNGEGNVPAESEGGDAG